MTTFDEYRRLIEQLPRGIAGGVELVAQQLAEPSERLLRLSGIPHVVDNDVGKVLMPDIPGDVLKAAIDDLLPLSFIINTDAGYSLHDEVRTYLFGEWLKTHKKDITKWRDFESINGRLADYYAQVANKTDDDSKSVAVRQRIFHLIGANRQKGFSEFEVQCRADRYRFRLESCESLINLVREYDSILPDEMKDWLDYHEAKLLIDMHRDLDAKELLQQLIKRESARANPALFSRCLFRLAIAERKTGDFDQARGTYNELASYSASQPEALDQALRAVQGFGSLLIEMGETKEAEMLLRAALQRAERNNDRSALATIWNSMGILHRKLGQFKDAFSAFNHALEELEQAGEEFRPRQVYNNIGLLHADRSEWDAARENLEKTREMARTAGDMDGEATALSNLVRVYLALSEPAEAIAAADDAIRLFKEVHNWHGAAMTNRGIARYYRRERRTQECRAAFLQAMDLFERAGMKERANEMGREIDTLDKATRPRG